MSLPPARHATAVLAGRGTECARLDQLLAHARMGQSAVLVLRGEPGVGKSALLDYAVERAAGWRVLRALGAEWEMELRGRCSQRSSPLPWTSVCSLGSSEARGNPLALLE